MAGFLIGCGFKLLNVLSSGSYEAWCLALSIFPSRKLQGMCSQALGALP